MVEKEQVKNAVDLAIKVINSISGIRFFRTLAISATGIPYYFSKIWMNDEGRIPRTEVLMREGLLRKQEQIPRIPIYSDYGINHPDNKYPAKGKIDFPPVLRYSLDTETLIVKGGRISKFKFRQVHDLAKKICDKREFMGSNFSPGDRELTLCGNRLTGHGDPRKWIEMATSHHLVLMYRKTSQRNRL